MVSKPFLQIRQTGWTLAYMVMPAVASLVAARDERSLDRLKYDGTRLLVAAVLPVTLLAWVYAGPFLTLWVGDKLGYDAAVHAGLLRLFLVATVPLVLSVAGADGDRHEQAQGDRDRGAGRGAGEPAPELFPDAPAGGLGGDLGDGADDPVLEPAGARASTSPGSWTSAPAGSWRGRSAPRRPAGSRWSRRPPALRAACPLAPSPAGGLSLLRWLPLAAHLAVGCLAYVAGYLAAPAGRADLVEIAGKLAAPEGRPARGFRVDRPATGGSRLARTPADAGPGFEASRQPPGLTLNALRLACRRGRERVGARRSETAMSGEGGPGDDRPGRRVRFDRSREGVAMPTPAPEADGSGGRRAGGS